MWRKHQKVAPSAQVPASATAHDSQLVARVPTAESFYGSRVKPVETDRTNTCRSPTHVCDSFASARAHQGEHAVGAESLVNFSLPAFRPQLLQAPAPQPVCASVMHASVRSGGQCVVPCSAMLPGMEGTASCVRWLRSRSQRGPATLSKSVEQG